VSFSAPPKIRSSSGPPKSRSLPLRREFDLAERAFEEQLRWFEGLGSALASARSQWVLAQIAHRRGEEALARRLCEASIVHLEALDDVASIARAQHLLAEIAVGEGDRDRAAELFRSALETSKQTGDQRIATGAKSGLATIAGQSMATTEATPRIGQLAE
jgi:hypothetical protein